MIAAKLEIGKSDYVSILDKLFYRDINLGDQVALGKFFVVVGVEFKYWKVLYLHLNIQHP